MSLLDYGTEDIVIFHEEPYTDADGNTMFRPSVTGVPVRATVQPLGQSGTSSRLAEQSDEGYETEETYRLRLPRGYAEIGSNARVEWRGVQWYLHGKGRYYNGSARTAHTDYRLRRA